jgi:hypothetical protein
MFDWCKHLLHDGSKAAVVNQQSDTLSLNEAADAGVCSSPKTAFSVAKLDVSPFAVRLWPCLSARSGCFPLNRLKHDQLASVLAKVFSMF